jgi:hypothetical protein
MSPAHQTAPSSAEAESSRPELPDGPGPVRIDPAVIAFARLLRATEAGAGDLVDEARSRLADLGWRVADAAEAGGACAEDGARAEAAEPAPGVTVPAGLLEKMAEILGRLEVALGRLEVALDRQADPRPEPLAFRKRDAARMVGVSVRLFERLVCSGKGPHPVAHAGRCPLFSRAALERWLAQGGSR